MPELDTPESMVFRDSLIGSEFSRLMFPEDERIEKTIQQIEREKLNELTIQDLMEFVSDCSDRIEDAENIRALAVEVLIDRGISLEDEL